MKRFFIILLAVAVIGALILGGCAKKTTSTTTTTTQTQTSTSTTTTTPHKVLKIGSVAAMNSPSGVENKKWYDLVAKLVNEQGGWKIGADTYDVDMIIYDGQGDPAKSKNYLDKLVLQDGVKFIFDAPTGDPATDAEVTEPNKVIVLGMDSTDHSSDPKLQYYYTPMGMFFSNGYLYAIDKDLASRGMKSYASLKTDDMMGHFMDGMVNKAWAVAAPSVKYTNTVFYDPATSDFGPIATKLMSLHPDVIDCNAISASQIYNALYDAGFKGTIIPGMITPETLQAIITHCGKAFMEGWATGSTDPRGFQKDPAMLALIDAYTKEYGTFNSIGTLWLCYWFVLKDAIEHTQSVDVDVIKAYLDKSDHPVRTLTGYSQLFARPDKGNLRTVSGETAELVAVIKDGAYVPLRGVAVKEHYLSTILSSNLVDVYKAYWEQYGYPTFPADQPSLINFSDLGITGHD